MDVSSLTLAYRQGNLDILDVIAVSTIFRYLPVDYHSVAGGHFRVTREATTLDLAYIGCLYAPTKKGKKRDPSEKDPWTIGVAQSIWRYRMHELFEHVDGKNVYDRDDLYAVYNRFRANSDAVHVKIVTRDVTLKRYTFNDVTTLPEVYYARLIAARCKLSQSFLMPTTADAMTIEELIIYAALQWEPYPTRISSVDKFYGTHDAFTGSPYYWLDPTPAASLILADMKRTRADTRVSKPYSRAMKSLIIAKGVKYIGSSAYIFRPPLADVIFFIEECMVRVAKELSTTLDFIDKEPYIFSAMKISIPRVFLKEIREKFKDARPTDIIRDIIRHFVIEDRGEMVKGMVDVSLFFVDVCTARNHRHRSRPSAMQKR